MGIAEVVPTLTVIGLGIYVAWTVWQVAQGVFRGDISDAEFDAAIRRGGIDGDVHDGSYGSRDGEVWCELCHRYHPA